MKNAEHCNLEDNMVNEQRGATVFLKFVRGTLLYDINVRNP